MVTFHTLWKYQTFGFLMISEGIEKFQKHEMG